MTLLGEQPTFGMVDLSEISKRENLVTYSTVSNEFLEAKDKTIEISATDNLQFAIKDSAYPNEHEL